MNLNFFKDFKNLTKNKNNGLIAVILIIGAILIFMSGGSESVSYENKNEEQRLEEILSDIESVGEVSVMITYYEEEKYSGSEKNKAKGAVVVASGCRNDGVKSAISDAVCAALDLPAHKVCVYLKKR